MHQLLSPISSELASLEPLLAEYLSCNDNYIDQITSHPFHAGGKRLRPSLLLLAAKMIGYSSEHLFPVAAACEHIHAASLLHDDVINHAKTRRTKATVNALWSNSAAILAGDYIFSSACRLLIRTSCLPLIDIFARCIQKMSESEIYQTKVLWKPTLTEDEYWRIIEGKTALLFEACACAPAMLAGSDSSLVESLAGYGRNLGLAFQIVDDCLDLDGEELVVGKPVLADLSEGKITLPMICALQKETPPAQELASLLDSVCLGREVRSGVEKRIAALAKDAGGVAAAQAIARHHENKARACLNSAVAYLGDKLASREAFESLEQVCGFVVGRTS